MGWDWRGGNINPDEGVFIDIGLLSLDSGFNVWQGHLEPVRINLSRGYWDVCVKFGRDGGLQYIR